MRPYLLAFLIFVSGQVYASTGLAGDTVCVAGVGDIMLGTDFPSGTYLPPGDDCSALLNGVRNELVIPDITFGNLEGTFAGAAVTAKKCLDTTRCFVFRIPEKYVTCLTAAGFDLLSMANNHSGDFGAEGQANTVKTLEAAGIAFAGLINHPYVIIVKDSVRYGLCAFAPNPGTCSILDIEAAKKLVGEVSRKCDILLVSFHGGGEGEECQHVTREEEEYIGNSRGNVYEFAHAMIDAGADILFGHGPHVTRAVELYRDRLICYSLGNFCTYGRFNLSGPRAVAPLIKVYTSREGGFLYGEIIPVRQTGKGFTSIDPQKQAISIIRQLTDQDFPESNLLITDEGLIVTK